MADTFQLIGRSNGKAKFSYGPKKFSANWGGVFTAFQIANFLAKRTKGRFEASKGPMRRIGKIVEKRQLKAWLERLSGVLFDLKLDNMLINATDVNLVFPDKILPSQLITFDGYDDPVEPVANALIRMKLNHWGVVKELTRALSEFSAKGIPGKHSATVSITV